MMVFLQVWDWLEDLPKEGLPVIEMDWLLGIFHQLRDIVAAS